MGSRYLLVRVGGQLWALPTSSVIETVRVRYLTPIANLPSYVVGVAVIRGVVTPVVDLARIVLGAAGTLARVVTVRSRGRVVALAVDGVVGISDELDRRAAALPPLLRDAVPDFVESLAELDGDLLAVLSEGLRLPETTWQAVAEVGDRLAEDAS